MLVRPYLAYNWVHICVHGELETNKFKYMKKLLSILLGLMFMTSCGLKELKESVEERERQEQEQREQQEQVEDIEFENNNPFIDDEPEEEFYSNDNKWVDNLIINDYRLLSEFNNHKLKSVEFNFVPNTYNYGADIYIKYVCVEGCEHKYDHKNLRVQMIVDDEIFSLHKFDSYDSVYYDLEFLIGNKDQIINANKILLKIYITSNHILDNGRILVIPINGKYEGYFKRLAEIKL